MYAIIETGGKQYRVIPGQTIDVERLSVAAENAVELDRVLLVADGDRVLVGNPLVSGARVVAQVVAQHRAPKVVVFKYKPKVRYRRKHGHRQSLTRLSIQHILLPE
ncbi:MAG: 50S ribosomal protein L21 [Chloroflexi bacterium]|nr:50S ribosomal protein L21 [Chloroflexota bacterium]